MKCVSWNCNGAFRKKFHLLDDLDADVLVIQECENPAFSSQAYRDWAAAHFWIGENGRKGLGVFVKGVHRVSKLDWPSDDCDLFLPVSINEEIDLLAVWTKSAKTQRDGYIGQLLSYLRLNRSRLGEKTVLCGDFNSNAIWDSLRRGGNHSSGVEMLEEVGLVSLYHSLANEAHGQESVPTFYLHRQLTKFYHIDYAFAHRNRQSAFSFDIGLTDEWLTESDHMPITFTI